MVVAEATDKTARRNFMPKLPDKKYPMGWKPPVSSKCVACGGTGKNSNKSVCTPCYGTGKRSDKGFNAKGIDE